TVSSRWPARRGRLLSARCATCSARRDATSSPCWRSWTAAASPCAGATCATFARPDPAGAPARYSHHPPALLAATWRLNMTAPTSPVVLITGANRGLGLETARQLAAAGYEAVLGSR